MSNTDINIASDAIGLGNAMSDKFNKELAGLVQAGEDVKRGPLVILAALNAEDVDLSEFAEPDTEEGDADLGNKIPEKRKISVTKTDGSKKTETKNWYTEFTAATADAKDWQAKIDDIKLAMNVETRKQAVIYKDYVGNNDYLMAEKKMLEGRITSARKLIKTAIKIDRKIAAINESGMATVDFVRDRDGQPARTTYPMTIENPDKAKGTQGKQALSISQFLALDVAKAAANGNRFDDLLDTLSNDTNGAGKNKGVKIDGYTPLIATFGNIGNYLDVDSADGQAHMAQVLKALKGKDKDGDVLAIQSAFIAINALYSQIEERATRISREQANAA